MLATGRGRLMHERRSPRSADLQLHVRSATSPVAERTHVEQTAGLDLLGLGQVQPGRVGWYANLGCVVLA